MGALIVKAEASAEGPHADRAQLASCFQPDRLNDAPQKLHEGRYCLLLLGNRVRARVRHPCRRIEPWT